MCLPKILILCYMICFLTCISTADITVSIIGYENDGCNGEAILVATTILPDDKCSFSDGVCYRNAKAFCRVGSHIESEHQRVRGLDTLIPVRQSLQRSYSDSSCKTLTGIELARSDGVCIRLVDTYASYVCTSSEIQASDCSGNSLSSIPFNQCTLASDGSYIKSSCNDIDNKSPAEPLAHNNPFTVIKRIIQDIRKE